MKQEKSGDVKIHAKYDELCDPRKLKNYSRNRNKHPQSQIERLASAYKFHGIRHPIVVDKERNVIAAGHGRKLAAIRAGIKEFPVVYQSFESEESLYTFCQADNASTLESELDLAGINLDLAEIGPFDINSLLIPDFEIEPADKYKTDPDEVPEVDKKNVKTKLGDLYELGNHRLMCGDNSNQTILDILLDGKHPDLIFTDPPYGIGIDGQKKSISKIPSQSRKAHEFKGWDAARPSNYIFETLLNMDITTIIFGGNYFSDILPASRGWIYWGKGQDGALTSSDGELAWTNLDKPLRSITINRQALKGSVHPTQKPIEVVTFCLDYSGKESLSVLDPFGGSGSTLIACEKTNRKCFMMELDPYYIDVIVGRWVKFTGQNKIKLNGEDIEWTL